MDQQTRRTFLRTTVIGGAAAGAVTGPWVRRARAQGGPVKIGVVLPYTGVYAELGNSITQAMELVFARENWTVAGRKIEMVKEDDEMAVPVGVRKTEKLIDSDKVDILTGPVHSGILMGMRDKVHNSKTILHRVERGRRRRQPRPLLEVDLPDLLLQLAALPAHGWVGRGEGVEGGLPDRAELPGRQGHDGGVPGDLPSGRWQGRRRGLSEARRDRLRTVPDQDQAVRRQGGVRVLLRHRRRELRQAVRRVRAQAGHQAHRRRAS